jgi:hypothetical protein
MVPVVPGTPSIEAPIEERTETCNIDAWWVIGIAFTCDIHLRLLIGDEEYERLRDQCEAEGPWDMTRDRERDSVLWNQRHRYEQNPEVLPERHPVRVRAESARQRRAAEDAGQLVLGVDS